MRVCVDIDWRCCLFSFNLDKVVGLQVSGQEILEFDHPRSLQGAAVSIQLLISIREEDHTLKFK